MVVYGRVVLVIPKQSFMAQLFVTQITVVISSHYFCVEHHGMMVKLARHPAWLSKGRYQTVFRIPYPGTIKPDTQHTPEM